MNTRIKDIVEMAILRKGTNPTSGNVEDIYRHTTQGGIEFWYLQQLNGGTAVTLQFNKKGDVLPKTATQPERVIEKDSWSLVGVIGDHNALDGLMVSKTKLNAYEALNAQP